MPDCLQHRVARRYLESSTPVVVVVHIDPSGVPWGWYHPHLARMHITPLSIACAGLIWLEDGHGHRAFDVARAGPSLDIDMLRASVSGARDGIESAWLRWCTKRDWINYSRLESSIYMYSGTSRQFARHLKEEALTPESLSCDLEGNRATFEARLNRLVWRGADDGSDAIQGATPCQPDPEARFSKIDWLWAP